jgi:hypothetical protein
MGKTDETLRRIEEALMRLERAVADLAELIRVAVEPKERRDK